MSRARAGRHRPVFASHTCQGSLSACPITPATSAASQVRSASTFGAPGCCSAPRMVTAGPAVTILGAEQHPGAPKVDALRTWEAADVAGVIGQALSEPWQVCDAKTGRWRPARARDIAVLVRSEERRVGKG